MSKKKGDNLPTGSSLVNKALKDGIKAGDMMSFGNNREYSRSAVVKAAMRFKDPGLLAKGIDRLTKVETFLRKEKLTANITGRGEEVRDVYVVYAGNVTIDKGLFFVTKTLAEVHFENITSDKGKEDSESSGGRTIQEMIQHLFHS